MLDKIVAEHWFRASAVLGFWPASADGDDIRVYADETRGERRSRCCTPCASNCRSAKAAPMPRSPISSRRATAALGDYIGAFAVTAGIGEDEIAERFKRANDDYSAIMVKALADRLAEAFAERLHQRVRKEFWGYAPDETLSNERTDRREISRHPPGAGLSGAARPHREGHAVPTAGRRAHRHQLTESFAMWPGAAVCGLYFSHPESALFRRRQDRARPGRGLRPPQGLERGRNAKSWLAPILNYDIHASPSIVAA